MKIAILSDLHGNIIALEAVLEAAKKENVERLIILGDFVGYYYHPDKIINLLQSYKFDAIKGNHEIILEDLYKNRISGEEIKQKYGSGHEIALKKLGEFELNWLFELPTQLNLEIDNVKFQLNHGSPNSINEYLYPDSNIANLESCNSNIHDFVLIGHSHYSFNYKCKDSILINCGSVGQSRQLGGYAFWTLVNTKNKTFSSQITKYDVLPLIKEIKSIEENYFYSSEILCR